MEKQIKGHKHKWSNKISTIIIAKDEKGEKRIRFVTSDKKSEVEEVMLVEEALPCLSLFHLSTVAHSELSILLGFMTKDPLETSSSKVQGIKLGLSHGSHIFVWTGHSKPKLYQLTVQPLLLTNCNYSVEGLKLTYSWS